MEHVHRCLSCAPDMVPDFDRADPRYHDSGKCHQGGRLFHAVTIDGAEISYTSSHFEDSEGWALFVGATADDMHMCSCGSKSMCSEPRFGVVTSRHLEFPA